MHHDPQRLHHNGAPLLQWPCQGAATQLWVAESLGPDLVRWRSLHSHLCIDIPGASHAHIQLHRWECNGLPQQVWGFCSIFWWHFGLRQKQVPVPGELVGWERRGAEEQKAP